MPTDNRPFFFNQLRFPNIPEVDPRRCSARQLAAASLRGNLLASVALVLILVIAFIAVVCTIVLPLRAHGQRPLLAR